MSITFFCALILTLLYILNNQILNIYIPTPLTKKTIIKDDIIFSLMIFFWIWLILGNNTFHYILACLITPFISLIYYYHFRKIKKNVDIESFIGKQGIVTQGTDGSFSIGKLNDTNEYIMFMIDNGHQPDMVGKPFEIIDFDENNKSIIRGKIVK